MGEFIILISMPHAIFDDMTLYLLQIGEITSFMVSIRFQGIRKRVKSRWEQFVSSLSISSIYIDYLDIAFKSSL
jgi:hypothetical protein